MKHKVFAKIGRKSGVSGHITAACAVLLLLFAMHAQAAERQVLRGHVPAAVAHLQPMGKFAGTNRLNLAIGLPLRNQEALTSLLHQIYDPASPELSSLPDAGAIHRAVWADGKGLRGGHRFCEGRTV